MFGRFSTCPPNVIVPVLESTNKSRVFWDEPQFTIAETIITQNHFSGSDFFIGRTDVIYSAERNGLLLDECRFTINILGKAVVLMKFVRLETALKTFENWLSRRKLRPGRPFAALGTFSATEDDLGENRQFLSLLKTVTKLVSDQPAGKRRGGWRCIAPLQPHITH